MNSLTLVHRRHEYRAQPASVKKMKALADQGALNEFQGMVREALYSKCIYRSPRYRDMDLFEIADYLIGLFFNAVGYTETEN